MEKESAEAVLNCIDLSNVNIQQSVNLLKQVKKSKTTHSYSFTLILHRTTNSHNNFFSSVFSLQFSMKSLAPILGFSILSIMELARSLWTRFLTRARNFSTFHSTKR